MSAERPVTVRRRELSHWINERAAHSGLTAQEIVDLAGIYEGHGRYDRCFDDLQVLARQGRVTRSVDRPARWYSGAVTSAPSEDEAITVEWLVELLARGSDLIDPDIERYRTYPRWRRESLVWREEAKQAVADFRGQRG